MARPIQLPSILYDYDFVSLARRERNARVCIRRLLALAHLQKEKNYTGVAGIFKVNISAPRRWIKRLVEGGLAGLQEKPGRGRKLLLPAETDLYVQEAIEKWHQHARGGRARAKDVQQLLYDKFGVKYALPGVYRTLHRAGLSWITARSKHPKANLEAQEAFKKTLQKT